MLLPCATIGRAAPDRRTDCPRPLVALLRNATDNLDNDPLVIATDGGSQGSDNCTRAAGWGIAALQDSVGGSLQGLDHTYMSELWALIMLLHAMNQIEPHRRKPMIIIIDNQTVQRIFANVVSGIYRPQKHCFGAWHEVVRLTSTLTNLQTA